MIPEIDIQGGDIPSLMTRAQKRAKIGVILGIFYTVLFISIGILLYVFFVPGDVAFIAYLRTHSQKLQLFTLPHTLTSFSFYLNI